MHYRVADNDDVVERVGQALVREIARARRPGLNRVLSLGAGLDPLNEGARQQLLKQAVDLSANKILQDMLAFAGAPQIPRGS